MNGVKLIPSSLVTCFVQDLEVCIVELAYEGFSIRVPNELTQIEPITLHFLQPEQCSYHSLVLEEYQVELSSEKVDLEKAYAVTYTITTNQKEYRDRTRNLLQVYGEYISLKLTGDDGYLSENLVAYPSYKDEEFYTVFEEQKRDWLQTITVKDAERLNQYKYELAISIDRPKSYQEYLELGIEKFQSKILQENYLANHPLFIKRAERVYLGNQFCHNLFPPKNILLEMMDKAVSEKLAITLVFTYMRDELQENTTDVLYEVSKWCKMRKQKLEIVVNDWGMIRLIQDLWKEEKKKNISLNLGVLLNKRRKDPRYQYKRGVRENVDKFSDNNLNSESFQKYLREKWNIQRFEYEVCQSLGKEELGYHVPSGHHSMHMPYYQTNTSQYCTLHAKCSSGDRGRQKLVRNCPFYCEEKVFLYPKHLKMVGRYNSLFGFEDAFLKEPGKLNLYLTQGIDRIVCTLF